MIVESIRMLTDGLAHPTYGINAKLAALTTDDGDPIPSAIAVITDETRNGEVARGLFPEERPCMVVTLASDVELEPEVMQADRDADITFVIRFALADLDTENGAASIYYVFRALQQTLKDFDSNDHAADRTRNGILMGPCTKMIHHTVYKPREDDVLTSALSVTMQVRDTQP